MWPRREPPAPSVSSHTPTCRSWLPGLDHRPNHCRPSPVHLKPASMLAFLSAPASQFLFSPWAHVHPSGNLGLVLLFKITSAAARVLSKFHRVLSNTEGLTSTRPYLANIKRRRCWRKYPELYNIFNIIANNLHEISLSGGVYLET